MKRLLGNQPAELATEIGERSHGPFREEAYGSSRRENGKKNEKREKGKRKEKSMEGERLRTAT